MEFYGILSLLYQHFFTNDPTATKKLVMAILPLQQIGNKTEQF